MRWRVISAMVALGACGIVPAYAVTIYKVIGADGSVTYQNTPPPKNARVETKEIDPNQNVMVGASTNVGSGPRGGGNANDSARNVQTNLQAIDELVRRSLAGDSASAGNTTIVNSGRATLAEAAAAGSAPNQGGAGTGAIVTSDTSGTGGMNLGTTGTTNNGITNSATTNAATTNAATTGGTTSNFGTGTGTNTFGTSSGGTTSNFGVGTGSSSVGGVSGGTTSNYGVGTGTSNLGTTTGTTGTTNNSGVTNFGTTTGSGTGTTTGTTSGTTTGSSTGTTVFPNGMNVDLFGSTPGTSTSGTGTSGTGGVTSGTTGSRNAFGSGATGSSGTAR